MSFFSAPGLPTFALLLLQANAVTITLYVSGTTGCNGNVAQTCNDIAEFDCCSGGGRYGSALFTGLPTEGVPAQGVTYNYVQLDDGTLENCGNSCNAGSGLGLCLSCTENNPTGPYLDGANWFFPAAEAKRDESSARSCNPVKPDMLTLRDGRSFHINHDVPEEATESLLALAERSAMGVDIEVPEHLLEYEI